MLRKLMTVCLFVVLITCVGCDMQGAKTEESHDVTETSTKQLEIAENESHDGSMGKTETDAGLDTKEETEEENRKEIQKYKHYTDEIKIDTYEDRTQKFEELTQDTSVVLSYKIADIHNVAVYPLYVYHKTGDGVNFDYSFSQTEISVISNAMNQCIASTTSQSAINGESGTFSGKMEYTWQEQFMANVSYSHNNSSSRENAQDNQITIESYVSNQKEFIKEYSFGVESGSFDGLPEAYYRISLKATAEVYEIVTLHYATKSVDVSYKVVYRNFYFDCDYSQTNNFDIPMDIYEDAGITAGALAELYESKIGRVENQLYDLVKSNVYLDLNDATGNKASCSASSIVVSYQGTYEELPTPIRVGWVFLGWKAEDGHDVKKTSKVTKCNNHTLKAEWELVTSTRRTKNETFTVVDGNVSYQYIHVTEDLDLNYLIGRGKSVVITVAFDVKEINDGYQNFAIADAAGYQDGSDQFWGQVSFNNCIYSEKINKGIGKQSYSYSIEKQIKAEKITTGDIWLAFGATGSGKNDFSVSNLSISIRVVG